MNFNEYKIGFTKRAYDVGYDEPRLQFCLNYAKRLFDNGVPVIFNSSHLCALIGYNKRYVNKAVFFTPKYYKEFRIRKSSGTGFRVINEPLPSLKEIQEWILINVLKKKSISKYAKAYIKDVGLIHNVKYHRGKNWVYTIDLKDFFNSIKQDFVFNQFCEFGYGSTISKYLTSLCTLNSALPQGAPTSPALSNLILRSFDDIMGAYCKIYDINYTRYADDLTFSSMNCMGIDKIIENLRAKVLASLPNGLEINESKTRLRKPGKRQIVTGIVVNKKPQLPIEKRKRIRQEIYFIKKHGLVEHTKWIGSSEKDYIAHLLGRIGFGLYINRNDQELNGYKAYLINEYKGIVQKT